MIDRSIIACVRGGCYDLVMTAPSMPKRLDRNLQAQVCLGAAYKYLSQDPERYAEVCESINAARLNLRSEYLEYMHTCPNCGRSLQVGTVDDADAEFPFVVVCEAGDYRRSPASVAVEGELYYTDASLLAAQLLDGTI